MAIITTHTLNSADGTHASGIEVDLKQVGELTVIASSKTDEGGRLVFEIDAKSIDPNGHYEMVFHAGKYWQNNAVDTLNIIREIVLRFEMADVKGKYHMPIILSPYGYSTWKAG